MDRFVGTVHGRQVWWCWIINDPFFPRWPNADKMKCTLCDMESDGPNPDKVFLAYHRLVASIGRSSVTEYVHEYGSTEYKIKI